MAAVTCALGPDSAGTLLTELLRGVRRSVDAAFFEVGPSYSWLFASAVRRGVQVRVVLDDHGGDGNRATAAMLAVAGAACRVVGGPAAFHPKLLVVDDHVVAVGTGNLVWCDAPRDHHRLLPPVAAPLRGTREWWALVHDAPTLVESARRFVGAAWAAGRPPHADWREPSSSPDEARVGTPLPQVAPLRVHIRDDRLALLLGGGAVLRCQQAVLGAAARRALVTVPYAHPASPSVGALLASLWDAGRRAADVGLLLGAPPHRADAERLGGRPAIRVMEPDRCTRGHAKGLVCDDTAVVSSANWSTPGLGCNWEAALVLRDGDVAAYFADAWRRDWMVSRSLGEFGAARLREPWPHHELI